MTQATLFPKRLVVGEGKSISHYSMRGNRFEMFDAPTTDRELIDSARYLKDVSVWEEIYTRYKAPILEHCRKSGLSPGEGEEIVQEIMSKFAQRVDKRTFNWQSTTFRGWLNQTTNHLIFEAHRRNRHKDLPPESVAQIRALLAPAFAPEMELVSREKMEAHLWSVCLARVRNEVKPNHWQIFEAYSLEGRSSAGVAQIFNTSQIQVRITRHRVLKRLRRAWRELQNGPLDTDDE